MEQRMYLITGVMASGKSTVSELLAGEFRPGVHLRGDIFRRMIAGGREDMCESPSPEALRQLEVRYALTAITAKAYYDAGFSVVIQDNYYGPELFKMLARLTGYPVRVAVLAPNLEAVRQREAGRSKKGYTGFSIESLYKGFMETTPRIGLWLDTSHMTPEETCREILASACIIDS